MTFKQYPQISTYSLKARTDILDSFELLYRQRNLMHPQETWPQV